MMALCMKICNMKENIETIKNNEQIMNYLQEKISKLHKILLSSGEENHRKVIG